MAVVAVMIALLDTMMNLRSPRLTNSQRFAAYAGQAGQDFHAGDIGG